MHRQIHPAWAWGFFEILDGHERTHPLNDDDLWTRVEIVLDSEGRIDKIVTVHASGNAHFDEAAREVVRSAAPYPAPPDTIRSDNGKVYIHWAFHRDDRACGTFGATPFILGPSAHRGVESRPTSALAPASATPRGDEPKHP